MRSINSIVDGLKETRHFIFNPSDSPTNVNAHAANIQLAIDFLLTKNMRKVKIVCEYMRRKKKK